MENHLPVVKVHTGPLAEICGHTLLCAERRGCGLPKLATSNLTSARVLGLESKQNRERHEVVELLRLSACICKNHVVLDPLHKNNPLRAGMV